MQKRRARIILLVVLLLLLGIPTGYALRLFRQERVDHSLLDAIKTGDTEAALAALKAGADPNAYEEPQRSPGAWIGRFLGTLRPPAPKARPVPYQRALFLAIWSAKQEPSELVRALLDRGADPNYATGMGYTPLMGAALRGYEECARLLLQKGAEPNVEDAGGYTPLARAIAEDHPNIVKLLLDNHADVNRRNKNGKTAFDSIATLKFTLAGQQKSTIEDEVKKIERMLRQAGAKTGE